MAAKSFLYIAVLMVSALPARAFAGKDGASVNCETCKRSQHKSVDNGFRAVAAAGLENGCRTVQSGVASWYGPGFQGRKTANGERFNTHALTAAHKSLPINTHVRVVNRGNGRAVSVRINDRGPYVGGRIIDLSQAAMHQIAGSAGTVKVALQICKNSSQYAQNDDD